MLITFIAGISAGAWVVTTLRFSSRPFRIFAYAELALAVTIGLSMFTYAYLPYWFVRLAGLLSRTEAAYPVYVLCQGVICFGVMFIPTLCLGMTLPLVSRVAASAVTEVGGAVGRVFAVNTLGTVLGTCLTGFVFLPRLGLARTFALGVGLNTWIGLAVLFRLKGLSLAKVSGPIVVLASLIVWGSGLLFDETWRGSLTMGMWRPGIAPSTASEFIEISRSSNIRFYRDGAGSTVSVHGEREGGPNLFLKVNGKTEASTYGDMTTQLLLAHVPMVLHPEPRNVLVVGLGSGVTAGSVAAHGRMQTLDVVEISPDVVEGARLFSSYNRNVLNDKRLRLVIDDAKSFLLSTDKKYDLIISEPSNPWMAGVANVFSREFYAHCKAHLAPGGLMVQWVQLYEFSDAAFDVVLATFASEFPSVNLWHTDTADLLLVGSVEPFKFELSKVLAALAEPSVKDDLDRIGLSNPVLFLGREVLSSGLGALLPQEGTRQHSDYYPCLLYTS
ncbi:MAG: fused MFS/spermidine synthase, partial [Verrucomicrobiae bacterium]|nr:fused MFS/spermidine synthase [Verrucomicrobiae bacterium]